jgi:hypothetical protein
MLRSLPQQSSVSTALRQRPRRNRRPERCALETDVSLVAFLLLRASVRSGHDADYNV